MRDMRGRREEESKMDGGESIVSLQIVNFQTISLSMTDKHLSFLLLDKHIQCVGNKLFFFTKSKYDGIL